jgi:predicted secreted Zn-dependent protease
MNRPDFSKAKWRKAIASGDGGCVEVAYVDGVIGVRDTKDNGAGPVLAFTQHEWTAFLAGAQAGEFQLGKLAD